MRKKGGLIEKIVFYIVVVAFIVMYFYIFLNAVNIHNEYKKCIIVDATVSNISIKSNGDINVTYDYKFDKKSYHNSQKTGPKELKIGDTTRIVVNKNEPQKIMQNEKEIDAIIPSIVYIVVMTCIVAMAIHAYKKEY